MSHWKEELDVQYALYAAYGLAAFALLLLLLRLLRWVRKEVYFASRGFRAHRAAIAAFVADHNELGRYIAEINARGSFEIGWSPSGLQSHLADFRNTSYHRYSRNRNVPIHAPNVHLCSLQIVRAASLDPLKYLMKYFDVRPEEGVLARVEAVGNSIAQLEGALYNLRVREADIARSFNPPRFIRKRHMREFMRRVGVRAEPIPVPYPLYIFQYVSAGGNSGQQTTIQLDTPTVDALIATLSHKIRWRRSVAGQRALMTAGLREEIKRRDGYACRRCHISVAEEPHLLLEVDHIVPVSRGGLTNHQNLQTLCWRCNRSKSNKLNY